MGRVMSLSLPSFSLPGASHLWRCLPLRMRPALAINSAFRCAVQLATDLIRRTHHPIRSSMVHGREMGTVYVVRVAVGVCLFLLLLSWLLLSLLLFLLLLLL